MIRSSQSTAKLPLLVAIIDADLSVRLSSARIVQALGWRAVTFARVFEFLRSNRMEEAACVVLDVNSRDLSGLTLQRWFTATHRPTRFVFVSAVTTDRERQRALEAGAIEFLRKPVEEAGLIRAVQMALGTENAPAAAAAAARVRSPS
jgi:FixJ family two-component response regulator